MKSKIITVVAVLGLSMALHFILPSPTPEKVEAFIQSEAYKAQEAAWLQSELGKAWKEAQ